MTQQLGQLSTVPLNRTTSTRIAFLLQKIKFKKTRSNKYFSSLLALVRFRPERLKTFTLFPLKGWTTSFSHHSKKLVAAQTECQPSYKRTLLACSMTCQLWTKKKALSHKEIYKVQKVKRNCAAMGMHQRSSWHASNRKVGPPEFCGSSARCTWLHRQAQRAM